MKTNNFTEQRHRVQFIRYADDWIVTATNPEILENQVKPAIKEFLAKRGLELSKHKTIITSTPKVEGVSVGGGKFYFENKLVSIKAQKSYLFRVNNWMYFVTGACLED